MMDAALVSDRSCGGRNSEAASPDRGRAAGRPYAHGHTVIQKYGPMTSAGVVQGQAGKPCLGGMLAEQIADGRGATQCCDICSVSGREAQASDGNRTSERSTSAPSGTPATRRCCSSRSRFSTATAVGL
jgi:hypothetical protein